MIAEFDDGRLEEVVDVVRVSSNETWALLVDAAVPFGFCTDFVSAPLGRLGRLAAELDDERDEQRTHDTQEDLTSQTT